MLTSFVCINRYKQHIMNALDIHVGYLVNFNMFQTRKMLISTFEYSAVDMF